MGLHVLNEPVGPPTELPSHEPEAGGLDRVADSVRHEPDRPAASIERPGEIDVLGERARGPAARRAERLGAVHREASRGDQRATVVILEPLVPGEGDEVLDVASALPDAAYEARNDEAARRGDGGIVERRDQPLDGVGLEGGVGVDRHGELGVEAGQREVLRARLRTRVARRTSDRCTMRERHGRGPVTRAVVDDHDLGDGVRLGPQAPDRVGHARGLVVGGNDDPHFAGAGWQVLPDDGAR